MISKGKIAAFSAVGIAVVLVAGGYGISVAKFDPALDAAETQIANFLNQELKLSERQALSLEFHETPESGLFSRKLTLVVADPQNNIQIPLDASIGFLNYKFDADLPNTTYNGQKLFDLYRGDVDNLTKFDLNASVHLISGKSEIIFEGAGLNNPRAARFLVKSSEDRDAFIEDAAKFAESKGFKQEGYVDVRVKFDREQNIETTGAMRNVLSPDFAVRELDFTSKSQGFGKNITDLGSASVKVTDLYVPFIFSAYHIQSSTLTAEASPFDTQGNFDLNLALQAQKINDDVKEAYIGLKASGLNYKGLIEMTERMAFSANASVDYLKKYPFNVELDPKTALVYHDKKLGKAVEITAQGKATSAKEQKIQGNATVHISEDIRQLTDIDKFSQFFVIENNQSKSEVQFELPFYGQPKVWVNGNPM